MPIKELGWNMEQILNVEIYLAAVWHLTLVISSRLFGDRENEEPKNVTIKNLNIDIKQRVNDSSSSFLTSFFQATYLKPLTIFLKKNMKFLNIF